MTSTTASGVTLLPLNSMAVMVLRSYVDRVRDALFETEQEWQGQSVTRKRPLRQDRTCRVIPTCNVAGVRKSRRGYALLLLEKAAKTSLKELSPMARQNIAWGVSLTHEFKGDDSNMEELGKHVLSTLCDGGFNVVEHVLRVDTFPKEMSASLCLSLQRAAGSYMLNPYEGPISMTKSASKCSHVLSVIRHETGFAWGVVDQPHHVAVRLNDDAAKEILIESTHTQTGENLPANTDIPNDMPVSRAYYKLRQVWDEILSKQIAVPRGAAGVDLGASPGGWTQVMRQHIGIECVVAIDPGILARRVSSRSGVQHVATDLASPIAADAIVATSSPIFLLVCDACIDSHGILDEIVQLVVRLQNRIRWELPAALVITLKMPYKTPRSLDRNMEKVKKTIPSQLRKIASLSNEQAIKIRYQIVHLMANSDSERTLVAILEA